MFEFPKNSRGLINGWTDELMDGWMNIWIIDNCSQNSRWINGGGIDETSDGPRSLNETFFFQS